MHAVARIISLGGIFKGARLLDRDTASLIGHHLQLTSISECSRYPSIKTRMAAAIQRAPHPDLPRKLDHPAQKMTHAPCMVAHAGLETSDISVLVTRQMACSQSRATLNSCMWLWACCVSTSCAERILKPRKQVALRLAVELEISAKYLVCSCWG